MSVRLRWLARQFARPSGMAGRLFIGAWLDRISRSANRLAVSRLAPAKGECILEVGFGGGDLLSLLLAAEPAEVIGADASEAMVARASRRFASEIGNGRLRLLHAPVESLALADGAADAAVSVSSLYFWNDLGAALNEMARVVKGGGRVVLVWETPEKLRAWPGHLYGFNVYDESDVRRAAEAAGFQAFGAEREDGFIVLSLRRAADMEGA
jgi:ubiquinone/menaquinone biosynthesis C-methylase UbiE